MVPDKIIKTLMAQGCVLIPLRGGKNSKKPQQSDWPNIKYTAQDIEGQVNLGINHKLSNTMSIDIDHKALGEKLLGHFGLKKKDLPGRYSARDDGWKFICKRPPGLDENIIRNLNVEIDGKVEHILELRANGHDVLPGSSHPGGGEYKFLNGGMPDELPDLPQPLVELFLNWTELMPAVVKKVYGVEWQSQDKDRTGEELAGNRAKIVDAFNADHTVEEVLERNDYHAGDNGRHLYPGSESGTPGVVIYGGVCQSYHESGDPLNDGRQHDAFDVMRILEHGGDWDQALDAVGVAVDSLAAADFADAGIEPAQVEPRPARKTLGFTRLSDLEMTEPQWLIPGILEERAISIWFGAPGAAKTFLVLDMAMHIAAGRNYHGMGEVKQGAVVYLAGEGNNGFARRVHAWCNKNVVDINQLDFHKSDRAGTFEPGETRKAMLDGIRAAFADAVELKARLFVVDTLARNLGGDENSSEAINAMFDLLNSLQEHYPEISILIVAHPGHQNPHRPRGSAALLGNTDAFASIEATAPVDGVKTARAHSYKMKDAEDFADMFFALDLEVLGVDSEGEQYGSLVPRMIDAAIVDAAEGEAVAADPLLVEKQRRWVTLNCFKDGHATRKEVQDSLGDRSLAKHNNNHYGDYLAEMVKDELLQEEAKSGQYIATDFGRRWLENHAEIIWS